MCERVCVICATVRAYTFVWFIWTSIHKHQLNEPNGENRHRYCFIVILLIQLIQLMKSLFTLFTNDFFSYIADSLPTLFILQKSFTLKIKINTNVLQLNSMIYLCTKIIIKAMVIIHMIHNFFFSRNIFTWNMLRILRIAEYIKTCKVKQKRLIKFTKSKKKSEVIRKIFNYAPIGRPSVENMPWQNVQTKTNILHSGRWTLHVVILTQFWSMLPSIWRLFFAVILCAIIWYPAEVACQCLQL